LRSTGRVTLDRSIKSGGLGISFERVRLSAVAVA
jgi:hypothetical protein